MAPKYGTCESQSDIIASVHSEYDEKELFENIRNDYCFPKRYVFSLLCFSACCLAVSYNVNLSIAIVSMVENPSIPMSPVVTENFSDVVDIGNITTKSLRLHWDGDIVGAALGAVYYGQLVSFIPGGRLAELYGGKKMIIICTMIAAAATAISPIVAQWNPYAFIVARVIVGIGTGPIIPIIFHMLARWIPEHERSFQTSFILSGYGVGSFLSVLLSGAICGSTFLDGWPAVFYAGALSGILWCCICLYLMSETPDVHPCINVKELMHIRQGLGLHKKERILKIPWQKMALSLPLWALAIGFFGQFWLLGFFSTVHALYMGTVINLPVAINGVLSCLPHILRAIATCMASYPVDLLLERGTVTVGFVRKAATITNSVVSCGAFLAITYVGRDVTATTILFVIAGVLGEFVTFGVCMGCIDIAPNLSGTVSGILNIVGVFPFFIIPAFVGWLTNYENSIEKWKNVFYFSIAIVTACTTFFAIFGDLKPQPWGYIEKSPVQSMDQNTDSSEQELLIKSPENIS